MPEFGSLEKQEVREYWEHEADDFTPWLADEIGASDDSKLEDTLGLNLDVIAVEKSVGRYNVDILAEVVDDNRKVVIENQLQSSDHKHLGQSLSYAAGVEADIIVWIAPRFYDEHRDAVQWLNENSREGIDFFAVHLEVVTIGNSEPAVRLNAVAEPSEWKERAKRSKEELNETEQMREEFWTEFRDRIEERNTPLSPRKPYPEHYHNLAVGKAGFDLNFTIKVSESELTAGLLIRDDAEAYWRLAEDREEIDRAFTEDVEWNEPEETRTGKERSKILVIKDADVRDEERWDEYLNWMIENGERFYEVFHPRIQDL